MNESLDELTARIKNQVFNKDKEYIEEYVQNDEGTLNILQWKLKSNIKKRGYGLNVDNEQIRWILSDSEALETILCSGYVQDHAWNKVLDILSEIIKHDNEAKRGYKLALATAVAITFSTPVQSLAIPEVSIDGLARYSSFVEWAETGQLFDNFFTLSAWQMRYVVGSWAEDEELLWARENALNDFKNPETIGEVTHKMIKYVDVNDEGVSVQDGGRYYSYRPVTLKLMYEVGAVCGGVSKFGSAMAQAFGIPAMPVAQPGHCAFLWWKNGEWVLSNDVSGLDKSTCHDGIQWTWKKDACFFLLMESAQKDLKNYRLSEKMRIASKFCEIETTFDILMYASSICSKNYLVWRDLVNVLRTTPALLNKPFCSPDILKMLEKDGFGGINNLSHNKIVKVSDCHERAQNIVDGTESEWWTSNESAWLEIDLLRECNIDSIHIQWWGTSVSKLYKLSIDDNEAIREVRSSEEEIESPTGYNSWSILAGWDTKTRKVRLELNNGSLDPWDMGKYFGIRQVVINGTERKQTTLVSQNKPVKVSECFERANNLVDGTQSEWWAENNEASVEIDFQQICSLDHIRLQWWGCSVCKVLKILTSTDGVVWETIASENEATEKPEAYNDWTRIPLRGIATHLKLQCSDGVLDPWGMNKYIGLRNILVYGTTYFVHRIITKQIEKYLEDHPLVVNHVYELLNPVKFRVISHLKPCSVSDCLERAENITDGTDSEWWSEDQSAWVELDLQMDSRVHELKIQWWGCSVSKDYRILVAADNNKDFHEMRTVVDEKESPDPHDYNGWSVVTGWQNKTRIIKLKMENGSLDPWGMNKYFGIRQIIVTGEEFELHQH